MNIPNRVAGDPNPNCSVFSSNVEVGPISRLPRELLVKIIYCINLSSFELCCAVNHLWDSITRDPFVRGMFFYQSEVFGNACWAKYGNLEIIKDENCEEEFQSLVKFIDQLEKCNILGKKWFKGGIIVRIPKSLNLKIIGELACRYFENCKDNGYARLACPDIMEPIQESYWIWMTKHFVAETLGLPHDVQKANVERIGCKLPIKVEVVACILAEYARSQKYLLNKVVSSCEDKIQGYPSFAGFLVGGLYIDRDYPHSPQFINRGAVGVIRS